MGHGLSGVGLCLDAGHQTASVEVPELVRQLLQGLQRSVHDLPRPLRRKEVAIAVRVSGVVEGGVEVLPEHVDGHAPLQRRHVVEPQRRDEEGVARLQDTALPLGAGKPGVGCEVRSVNVEDAGLVPREVEVGGLPGTEEGDTLAPTHLHQEVVHHLGGGGEGEGEGEGEEGGGGKRGKGEGCP